MYTEKANSPSEPKEIEIVSMPESGLSEVWIRKNIRKETEPRSDLDGCEESPGYVYDEVYFRTNATKEEIEQLEEASALQDISHMPARVKCAVLGWHTLSEALKED